MMTITPMRMFIYLVLWVNPRNGLKGWNSWIKPSVSSRICTSTPWWHWSISQVSTTYKVRIKILFDNLKHEPNMNNPRFFLTSKWHLILTWHMIKLKPKGCSKNSLHGSKKGSHTLIYSVDSLAFCIIYLPN